MQTLLLTIAGIMFPVFAGLSAGHALLNKRDPKSALGWVLCCLFLPYIGPLLYVVFGINRAYHIAHKLRPERNDDGRIISPDDCPDATRFPLTLIGRNVTRKQLLPCASVDMLVNGDEAYPAMLEAIGNAQHSICLASYIFANGVIATRFIDALKQAMARGVAVKVLLDGMGECMSFPPIGWSLARHGIPFKRFHPFTLLPPSLLINMRNHRKILVTDGTIAFAGGMNLADKNCHDLSAAQIQDVHFRITGPVVSDLEYAFVKDWQYCCGNRGMLPYATPVPEHIAITADTPWARLALDGPNEDIDKLSDILVGVMSAAKSRIWIMTPYFLPDSRLIGVLQAASLRNIDIKIILPSNNNIPPAHWATRHLLWQLLKYNIEVYYQAPPFSHSKLLLVDDSYSLIGSANLDPRSLRLNYELSLEIFSATATRQQEAYFLNRLESSTRYLHEDRSRRSLPEQLRDAAAWLLSPYL